MGAQKDRLNVTFFRKLGNMSQNLSSAAVMIKGLNDCKETIHNFTLKIFIYLDL